MTWQHICVFVLTLLINGNSGVIYDLNESDYNRMPPIFKLDDYERCLQKPTNLYCTVDLNLVSDTKSELLNMIKEYSEQTRTHYNHSRITHGVCVTQRCQHHIQDGEMGLKLSLEKCFNDTIKKDYELGTKVTDFSCYNSLDAKEEIDVFDISVAILLFVIVMFNAVGSIYDLRKEKITENKFLLCFSIPRNLKYLLSHKASLEPHIECLKGLNGIRCFILMGVIITHSQYPFACASQNSRDLELMFYRVRENVIMSGTLALQSNILISGFLLTYYMELYAENNIIDWRILSKSVLLRYFRLTPVFGVVIAVNATWVKFLKRGAMWKTFEMYTYCRSQWWHHMLYINNYFYNSRCMMTAWYVAMDMQLFCQGLLLCVVLKKKGLRIPVLSGVLLLGIIIVAFHTYLLDLDPIFIISPEAAKTLFGTHSSFNETYKRGHTNIPSFIIGMMLGYSVYRWKKEGIDVSKNRMLRCLYWALVPMGAAVMLSGELFYRDAPRDSLAIRVVYAALSKPLFAFLMAMLIAGIIFKVDNFYRKIVELNIWIIPSRLSYSIYMLNLNIIRLYMSRRSSLLWFSERNVMITFVITTVVTFVCAVPLWLMVEKPFKNVLQVIFNKSQKKKPMKNECKSKIEALKLVIPEF